MKYSYLVILLFCFSCENVIENNLESNEITVYIENGVTNRNFKRSDVIFKTSKSDIFYYENGIKKELFLSKERIDTIIKINRPVEINILYNTFETFNYPLKNGDSVKISYDNSGKPHFQKLNMKNFFDFQKFRFNKLNENKLTARGKVSLPRELLFSNINDVLNYTVDELKTESDRRVRQNKIQYIEELAIEGKLLDSLFKQGKFSKIDFKYYKRNNELLCKYYETVLSNEFDASFLKKLSGLENYDIFHSISKDFVSIINDGINIKAKTYKFNYTKVYDSLKNIGIDSTQKNIILFDLLEKIYKIENYNKSSLYIDDFLNMANSSIFKKEIYEKLVPKSTYDINSSFLEDFYGNKVTIQDVLSRNKNKIIVFDFWASWCTPCISSFPNSKKLVNQFKNKDFEFVYISIDNNNNKKWKLALEDNFKITDSNQFRALNFPSSKFYQDIKLNTIPRYLIFNRKGELIELNAPSPKSVYFKSKIVDLLNFNQFN